MKNPSPGFTRAEPLSTNEEMHDLLLFSFATAADEWKSIDDVVMGGASRSTMEVSRAGTGIFSGTVSLENNGGFASVRSTPGKHDLHAFTGIRLRVRGDGKQYKVNLKTDPYFDGISHQSSFGTTADSWCLVGLAFGSFVPTFRGRRLHDVPRLDTANISTFGIMISEKQAGSFRLEIEWIKAYA